MSLIYRLLFAFLVPAALFAQTATLRGQERQLPKNTTLALTYTNSHGVHLFPRLNA